MNGARTRAGPPLSRVFANRTEAGRELARELPKRLGHRPLRPPLVVYALPRGGVPVAAEVARALHVGNANAYAYWFLLGLLALWAFAAGLLSF